MEEKSGLQKKKKKMVENCENGVFGMIYVTKKKESLELGPLPRDGPVTRNRQFLRPKNPSQALI